jgi:hypothetical protein
MTGGCFSVPVLHLRCYTIYECQIQLCHCCKWLMHDFVTAPEFQLH